MLTVTLLIATTFSGCIGVKEAGLKPYQNPNLPSVSIADGKVNDLAEEPRLMLGFEFAKIFVGAFIIIIFLRRRY